tara:strand:- start:222 stop:392 length:171 start_codon:yes stop_codon:yes gene_type:complete
MFAKLTFLINKNKLEENIGDIIYRRIFAKYRGVEQLVARWAHNPKVAGSSPVPATK